MQCLCCGATVSPTASQCLSCGAAVASRTLAGGAGGVGVLTPIPGDGETMAAYVTRLSTAADDRTVGSDRPARRVVRGPLEEGTPFGTRYHIIRALGVGGMGAVYQAWDDELGVSVALKVIRPELAPDQTASMDAERRFKRELLLARQVTHKNVVRIHDLGEVGGIKYITMPYIQGRDLAAVLKEKGKLPVSTALAVARQIAAGL